VDWSLDGAIVSKELLLRFADNPAQSGTVGGYFVILESIFDQLFKVCRGWNRYDCCRDASDFVQFAVEVATKAG
jgi:hypothetical protein